MSSVLPRFFPKLFVVSPLRLTVSEYRSVALMTMADSSLMRHPSLLDIFTIFTIESVFSNCSSLKSLDLSSWDVSGVTKMTRAFAGTTGLTDLFIACTAPYGYRMVDKKKLEVIPEEAAVVRWIFSSYLKGRSMRWIAEVLIAKGISPHREPGLWTEVGIRYILTNEKYIGDSLCQKSYTCGFPFVRKKNCGEQMCLQFLFK